MKRLKKGTIVQIFGVLTLVVGQFFTAGTALADTSQTREVSAGNAAIVDDERRIVGGARVGDKKKLFFNVLANGNEEAGTVRFAYNHDFLEIKKKKYHYTAGDAELTVKIDEEDSTISWKNVDQRQHIFNVELPVEFKQTIGSGNLAIQVDGKNTKLPFIQVVPKTEQAPKGETDGDLANDSSINEMLEKEQAQKNQEKAQEYLKEKQKADAEKAAAKNEEAKQAKSENESAESQVAQKKQSQAAAKERASKAVDQIESEVTTTEEALDEADGEEPSRAVADPLAGSALRNAIPRNTGDGESEDPLNLTKNIERDKFFTKVTLRYKDSEGKEKSIVVHPAKDSPEELPAILRENNNVRVDYEWDLDSVWKLNRLPLDKMVDGAYYEFQISGLLYNYEGQNNERNITTIVNGETVTIGKFSISPVIDENGLEISDKHTIRVTFLPEAVNNQSNINYFASLETQLNTDADEFDFGQTIKDKGGISLEKYKYKLEKSAKFERIEEDGQTVKDLSSIKWNVKYSSLEDSAAQKVVLDENFGGGYSNDPTANGVSYKVKITEKPAEGNTDSPQEVIIDSKKDPELFREVYDSGTKRFVFDLDKGYLNGFNAIDTVEIEIVTPVTSTSHSTFENKIQVSDDSVINNSQLQRPSETIVAKINRSNILSKSGAQTNDGNIKYTVNFWMTPGESTNDQLVIEDILADGSENFMVDEDTVKVYRKSSNNNIRVDIDKLDIERNKMTVKLPSEAVEGLEEETQFILVYELKPKDGVELTPDDYKNVKNSVIWNGYKRDSTFNGSTDTKDNIGIDWQKETVGWRVNVNRLGLPYKEKSEGEGGTVTITEPTNVDDNYSDFSIFGKLIEEYEKAATSEEKAEIFAKFNNHLKVKKDKNDKVSLKCEFGSTDGTTLNVKLSNEQTDEKVANLAVSATKKGVVTLVFTGLPLKYGGFSVEFFDIPLAMDKMYASKEPITGFFNKASVNYNGWTGTVSKDVKLDKFMNAKAGKSGQLSSDFHKNEGRKIHWTTTFNHMNSFGPEEKKLLLSGLTISDLVGDDQIYFEGKAESHKEKLQFIKETLLNSLKVSLGNINKTGSGAENFTELEKGKDYEIEFDQADDTDHSVKFNLRLTEEGYDNFYADGKKIFKLEYDSDVPSLWNGEEDVYEHLKQWNFRNEVAIKPKDSSEAKEEMRTHATVSYFDEGYLLDKQAPDSPETIKLNAGTAEEEQVRALKWGVVINGEGQNLGRKVSLKDELVGDGHYHLNTKDEKYQLKIYEAKRVFKEATDNYTPGRVEYVKDEKKQLTEGEDYKVDYTDSSNSMMIEFINQYSVDKPLIFEYYTVASKVDKGLSYSNDIELKIGGDSFNESEKIDSDLSVGGSVNAYGVNFTKTDSEDENKVLAGVKFKLQFKSPGSEKWQDSPHHRVKETDEKGQIQFRGLFERPTYRIVEVEGLPGYDGKYISREFTVKDATEDSSEEGDENKSIFVLKAKNDKVKDLQIHKHVSSDTDVEINSKFKFQLNVMKGKQIDRDFNGSYNVTVDNGETFNSYQVVDGVMELPEIADNQTIEIVDLPVKYSYQVVELKTPGYTTTHDVRNVVSKEAVGDSEGKTDSFVFDSKEDHTTDGIITYTNVLKTQKLAIAKSIDGPNASDDKDLEFEFEILAYDKDGNIDKNFAGVFPAVRVIDNNSEEIYIEFKNGKAIDYVTKKGNGETAKRLTLKDNSRFNNIVLPANTRLKVREKVDSKYSKADVTIDQSETAEATTDGDGYFSSRMITLAGDKFVEWKNIHETSAFGFGKTIEGPDADADSAKKEFSYKIELSDHDYSETVEGLFYKDADDAGTKVWFIFDKGIATQYSETSAGENPKDISLKHGEAYRNIQLKNNPEVKITENVDGKYSRVEYLTSGSTKRSDAKLDDTGKQAATRMLSTDSYKYIDFFNIHDANKLQIVKEVEGEFLEGMDPFKFTIKALEAGEEGGYHPEVANKEFRAAIMKANTEEVLHNGSVKFNDQGVANQFNPSDTSEKDIILKDHERLVIYDLPKEVTFYIDEKTSPDYIGAWKVKGSNEDFKVGEAVANMGAEDVTVNFKNTITIPEPNSVNFTVDKKLVGPEGSVAEDHEFKFKVSLFDTKWTESDRDVKVEIAGQEETVKFTKPDSSSAYQATINLKAGEQFVVKDIPEYAKISVEEMDTDEDVTVSHKFNDNKESGNKFESDMLSNYEDIKSPTVTFTNEYPKTDLKLTKTLKGDGDKNQTFKFTPSDVSVGDRKLIGTYQAQIDNGKTHDVEFADGKLVKVDKVERNYFELKAGEILHITGLPVRTQMNITEESTEGYEVSYSINNGNEKNGSQTGPVITGNEKTAEVEFINTKMEPKTANLTVTKKVDSYDKVDMDQKFEFRLRAQDAEKVAGKTFAGFVTDGDKQHSVQVKFNDNGLSQTVKLGHNERLDVNKLPIDTKFRVIEVNVDTKFDVDHQIDRDEFKAGDRTGYFEVKDGTTHHVTFKNTNNQTDLIVEKKLGGSALEAADKDRVFEFEIKLDSDKDTAANVYKLDSNGNEMLLPDKLLFTEGKATIHLKGGEAVRIAGLPAGTVAHVIEKQAVDFETSNQVDSSDIKDGTESGPIQLKRETDRKVTFHNDKLDPKLANLTVTKKVDSYDKADMDQKFKFRLTAENAEKVAGKTFGGYITDADNNQHSEEIVFDQNGDSQQIKLSHDERLDINKLPIDTKFKVTEVDADSKFDVDYKIDRGEFKSGEETDYFEVKDGTTHHVTFKNTNNQTDLIVEKKLGGSALEADDKERKFKFEIKLDSEENIVADLYQRSINGDEPETPTQLDFSNGEATIHLKGGESARIAGLPAGTVARVTEELEDEFKTSNQVDNYEIKDGTESGAIHLKRETDRKVTFHNDKLDPELADLTVSKNVESKDDKDLKQRFDFYLESEDNAVKGKTFDRVITDAENVKHEKEIKFDADGKTETIGLAHGETLRVNGLPAGVKVKVVEENAEGFTTSHEVDRNGVKVGKETEEIELENQNHHRVKFVNSKALADLEIDKKVTSSRDSDNDKLFKFKLSSVIDKDDEGYVEANEQLKGSEFKAVITDVNNDKHDEIIKFNEHAESNEFGLRHNDRILIYGLPDGVKVEVSEIKDEDFEVQHEIGNGGFEKGETTEAIKLIDSEHPQNITFRNVRPDEKLTDLIVNKNVVSHIPADQSKRFDFRLNVANGDDFAKVVATEKRPGFEATITDQKGKTHTQEVKFAKSDRGLSNIIRLASDEELHISNLPAGIHVTVVETAADGFETTNVVDRNDKVNGTTTDAIKLVDGNAHKVEFENFKDAGYGKFTVNKFVNMDGNLLMPFTFNVELTDDKGQPVNETITATKKSPGYSYASTIEFTDGKGQFRLRHNQSIEFNLPIGYKYQVAEHDYSYLNYGTTTLKNGVRQGTVTVSGAITSSRDRIDYHNDYGERDDWKPGTPPGPGTPPPGPGTNPPGGNNNGGNNGNNNGNNGNNGNNNGSNGNNSNNGSGNGNVQPPMGLPELGGSSELDDPITGGTSGLGSASSVGSAEKPMGLPSSGYGGKLPQTGDGNDKLYTIIGMITLVMIASATGLYLKLRRKDN